ncbi:MAG: aspartyl/asparaginyl beta-hydroxylase domain-containing protein [Rhodanobacteraceae bacterium]
MNSRILPPNPRKTLSVRPLGPVDIDALREDILAIPESVWDRENAEKPNRFGALDRTQHIIFRFVSNFDDWRQSYERPLWGEWRERIEPVLLQATAAYGYPHGEFPRIMLAKMAAGGVIHPHVDANPAARWPHKIHIPIQTNPQVRFYVEPKEYHLEAGQVYEVNNMTRHAVRNDGGLSRIHLIFEYYDVDQPTPE